VLVAPVGFYGDGRRGFWIVVHVYMKKKGAKDMWVF
jgi:hypothetical protein